VNSTEAFRRPLSPAPAVDRKSMAVSLGMHGGIFALMLLAGLLFRSGSTPVIMGGGSMVSVEMVVLEPLAEAGGMPLQTEAAIQVETHTPVEVEAMHEVVEVLEPIEEVVPIEVQPVEVQPVEVQPVENRQPVVETPPASQFIAVGASGEAGAGAPGPASYEGRVFAAIRRNFVTSTDPPRTYRIHFTVNTDGTHRWEVVRQSGNPAFDRAVEHALETANIPPVPPGRTTPVRLSIEFLGPE